MLPRNTAASPAPRTVLSLFQVLSVPLVNAWMQCREREMSKVSCEHRGGITLWSGDCQGFLEEAMSELGLKYKEERTQHIKRGREWKGLNPPGFSTVLAKLCRFRNGHSIHIC